jgi:hypothetical protein
METNTQRKSLLDAIHVKYGLKIRTENYKAVLYADNGNELGRFSTISTHPLQVARPDQLKTVADEYVERLG